MSAKPAPTGTQRIAIRLTPERVTQLRLLADADGRTLSGLAAKIITDHIDRALLKRPVSNKDA